MTLTRPVADLLDPRIAIWPLFSLLALGQILPDPIRAQTLVPADAPAATSTPPAATGGSASTKAPQTPNAKEQELLDKIRQLKAPRWKSFGNCRYDWSSWRIAEGGVRTTSRRCGSPEVTSKVAVHCESLRVSHQTSQGTWGEWRLPVSQEESESQGGEDLMVANLCANAKPLPAGTTAPTSTTKPGAKKAP